MILASILHTSSVVNILPPSFTYLGYNLEKGDIRTKKGHRECRVQIFPAINVFDTIQTRI